MAIGTRNPHGDPRIADVPEQTYPAFLAESLGELRDAIRALARLSESQIRRVDEYISDTPVNNLENTFSLLPQFERIPELISNVIVAGPTSGQTSSQVGNTATNPGGSVTIASLGILPAGLYSVTVNVGLQGTVTAADANNMRLRSQAQTVQGEFIYPGVVGNYPQDTVIVQSDGVNAILVQSIGAASGASAIYAAELTATPISPTFTLRLGDRVWPLTLPPNGILTFSCNLLLSPNDVRSITSTYPGNWFLELMGTANVRNRT